MWPAAGRQHGPAGFIYARSLTPAPKQPLDSLICFLANGGGACCDVTADGGLTPVRIYSRLSNNNTKIFGTMLETEGGVVSARCQLLPKDNCCVCDRGLASGLCAQTCGRAGGTGSTG